MAMTTVGPTLGPLPTTHSTFFATFGVVDNVTANVDTSYATTAIYTATTTLTSGRVEEIVVENVSYVWELGQCYYDLEFGRMLTANADIAGKGVVLNYVLSAYMVCVLAIAAYLFNFVPNSLLGNVDKLAFARKDITQTRGRDATEEKVKACFMAFSDLQLVTGIGILIAGFAIFNNLNLYLWQIIVYLAWMSSYVCLTSIMFVKGRDRDDALISRLVRFFFIAVLVIMLFVALVPAANPQWDLSLDIPVSLGERDFEYFSKKLWGIPVHCLFAYQPGASGTAVVSYTLIFISYVLVIRRTYWPREGVWGRPIGRFLVGVQNNALQHALTLLFMPEKFFKSALMHRLPAEQRSNIFAQVFYRCLVLVYSTLIFWGEYLRSFIAYIYIIVMGVIWGSVQVFDIRNQASEEVLNDLRIGNFGQILPLVLLLVPLLVVVDVLTKDLHFPFKPSTSRSETTFQSGSNGEGVQYLRAPEVQTETTLESQTEPTVDLQTGNLSDLLREHHSRLSLHATDDTKSAFVSQMHVDGDVRKLLMSTWCFKITAWFLTLLIPGISVFVFYYGRPVALVIWLPEFVTTVEIMAIALAPVLCAPTLCLLGFIFHSRVYR